MGRKAKVRFGRWWVVAATGAALGFPTASQACRMYVQPTLEDIRFADLVVVGRVSDYRIIRDEEFRRRMLATPHLSVDLRRRYEDPRQGLISDYARFDVQVEEVLVGRATSRLLSVTWDNSTFAEPDRMGPGPYLIALRRADSAPPPLRGPSPTIGPSPEPRLMTLLQAPCSDPFIYEIGSEQARSLRRILETRRR
jgi:hypothetical protein